ncbi:MAG: STAS domain-containing protein [Acidobacteriota bacterium]
MVLSLITRKSEPDITIIELNGRITLGRESAQIEANVVKLLNEGVRNLVIDLSKVDYIDSTGIGIIAYCFGKISQAGARCRIAGARGLVMDLFRITRLESVIQFFPDAESASASLRTPATPA